MGGDKERGGHLLRSSDRLKTHFIERAYLGWRELALVYTLKRHLAKGLPFLWLRETISSLQHPGIRCARLSGERVEKIGRPSCRNCVQPSATENRLPRISLDLDICRPIYSHIVSFVFR